MTSLRLNLFAQTRWFQFQRGAKRLQSLLMFLGIGLLLSSCATQQTKVNQVMLSFKRGDVENVARMLDEAIPEKNNVYYLERGTVMRLLGPNRLQESTKSLLITDEVLRNSEMKRMSLTSSLSAIGGYFLSEGIGKQYELKGYEGSLLAYHIALNHVLQGRWDLARIEIMKMVKREQDLASFNQKKYDAIEQERRKGVKDMPAGTMINTSLQAGNPVIGGYPVNTLNDPEALQLKNSYQSAAAHYLAGFIFEQQGEPSLAAPGYRQAIELRPGSPFLKEALGNLDANLAKNGDSGKTDTLVIVETGFLPFIDTFKVNLPIPAGRTPKIVTIAYPYIQPNTERFNPTRLSIGNQLLNPQLIANVDAMVRRDLKDEMPGYILRGTSRAIASVVAQIVAERSAASLSRDRNQGALLGAIASLATGAAMSAVNSADVRHWTTLPAGIYMARANLPSGPQNLTISTPFGSQITKGIAVSGKKAVIYIRVFQNTATVMSSGVQ